MLNKVQIIGRLGQDPDINSSQSGLIIARLSIATTEKWRDKNSNELRENTEWHKVVFYGRQAEIAEQYLSKGSLVYVEGKLKTNKYTDKDNIDRWSTEITGQVLNMLSSNQQGDSSSNGQQRQQQNQYQSQTGGGTGQRQAQQGGSQQQSQRQAPRQQQAQSFEQLDDDLPF